MLSHNWWHLGLFVFLNNNKGDLISVEPQCPLQVLLKVKILCLGFLWIWVICFFADYFFKKNHWISNSHIWEPLLICDRTCQFITPDFFKNDVFKNVIDESSIYVGLYFQNNTISLPLTKIDSSWKAKQDWIWLMLGWEINKKIQGWGLGLTPRKWKWQNYLFRKQDRCICEKTWKRLCFDLYHFTKVGMGAY